MKQLETFGDKISLTGCKWSSLNAPSTETPVSHPFWGESFFLISTLWGNKELDSPYKEQDDGKFQEQNQLNRLQMVQFKCPGHWNLCVWSIVGWFPYSHFTLSGVIRNGIPSIKMRKLEKLWNKISSTGCKWSSLNAPSTETPVSHPFWGDSPFLIFPSLG